ncbi:hypothetical protein B566_EDAN006492 [Ephemera danica]|nr:hypothetical protein B566_EDAN006492 [Ephemera danica]
MFTGKVQALKKACAKGDKKKKKEIAEEIANLEAGLDEQHARELKEVQQENSPEVDIVTTGVDALNVSQQSTHEEEENSQELKLTKAQRRRNKKSEKDKERLVAIAQQEEENKFGPRNLEELKIKQLLNKRQLALHEIPSDGNCMYLAIAHQLSEKGEAKSATSLRAAAATHLRTHADEFRPFTCSLETGLELSEEEFQKYCDRTEKDSTAWGGHLELQALAEVLKKPIEVLQAEGPPVLLGDQYKSEPSIILTFHRHAFGLGEHYNSVKKVTPKGA